MNRFWLGILSVVLIGGNHLRASNLKNRIGSAPSDYTEHNRQTLCPVQKTQIKRMVSFGELPIKPTDPICITNPRTPKELTRCIIKYYFPEQNLIDGLEQLRKKGIIYILLLQIEIQQYCWKQIAKNQNETGNSHLFLKERIIDPIKKYIDFGDLPEDELGIYNVMITGIPPKNIDSSKGEPRIVFAFNQ